MVSPPQTIPMWLHYVYLRISSEEVFLVITLDSLPVEIGEDFCLKYLVMRVNLNRFLSRNLFLSPL